MYLTRTKFILVSTLGYLMFGLFWILVTDQLLTAFTDFKNLIWLSTLNNFLFVSITTIGIYFSIQLKPIQDTQLHTESLKNIFDFSLSLKQRPLWANCLFAILITLVTFCICLYIGNTEIYRPLMILFSLPIILSALIGGVTSGALSTGLSVIFQGYISYTHSNYIFTPDGLDLALLAAIIFFGLLISIFCEALQYARSSEDVQLKLTELVVNASNDAIYVKDISGRYLFINNAGANLLGVPREQILGKDDSFFFPLNIAQKIKANDQELFRNGTIVPYEQTLVSGGKRLVVDVNKGLIYNKNGHKLGLFGISRDVTTKKELEIERINNEILLRKSLVREVHHRIKNNLQGVINLLEQTLSSNPQLNEALTKAISKIQSISSVYGLQGQNPSTVVVLKELIQLISTNHQSLWGEEINFTVISKISDWTISESESIPLALVINELYTNAYKHQDKGKKRVDVLLIENLDKSEVKIQINNSGKLQRKNQKYKKLETASGLELIKLLLPRSGATFNLDEENGLVIASLTLQNPVITLKNYG